MARKKMFKTTVDIHEKMLDGSFDTGAYTYVKECDTFEQAKDIKDLLWQAIEIEGIGDTECFVEVLTEKNGEYLDRDEFVMATKIVRTDVPSKFVVWGDMEPHLFEVDKEKSVLNIELA